MVPFPRPEYLNQEVTMEAVDGIGGVFFRSKDPGALGKWYAEHLGVLEVPFDHERPVWRQAAGPTVFAP